MSEQPGFLTRFFGGPQYAPNNIVGVVCILLIVCGLVATFFLPLEVVRELWATIAPILALGLGYIFGKRETQYPS